MRSTLSVGVALLGSLVLSAPASAATETARTTNAFVDTVGVNIHSSYNTTPYDKHDQVLAALRDLGIRHVRDNFMPPTESAARQTRQRAFRKALAEHGIRTTVLLGEPGEDPAAYIASARLDEPGVIAALEGPNEHDLSKRPNWVAEVRDYQQRLFAAAKADPKVRDLPLLGPSVGNPNNAAAFGDVSAWSDRANIHAYPGGKAPGTFTDVVGSQAASLFGGKTAVVTETGYHNAGSTWGGHPYVPEAVSATYLPKLFLDNFRRGIERTFSYELVNTYSDPQGWNPEAHFGLLRQDFSMKPAAERMRNLLRLVDPAATAGAPAALDYTLQGDVTGVERVLLRRADGTFVLAIWQKARVYDEYARREIGVPARALTLRTAAPMAVAVGRTAQGARRDARRRVHADDQPDDPRRRRRGRAAAPDRRAAGAHGPGRPAARIRRRWRPGRARDPGAAAANTGPGARAAPVGPGAVAPGHREPQAPSRPAHHRAVGQAQGGGEAQDRGEAHAGRRAPLTAVSGVGTGPAPGGTGRAAPGGRAGRAARGGVGAARSGRARPRAPGPRGQPRRRPRARSVPRAR
ncbi:hypothetical protein [Svornostia abyssi]|uniref:hypothetical protein n=1 Tax=Svornostia abyssi TaxID=2898438 RepID=UPI00338E4C98